MRFTSSPTFFATLMVTIGLYGCAPLVTQNPGQGFSPANVKDINDASRLLLDGHDVTTYFTDGKHTKGKAEHSVAHKGVTLWFASAENKAKFEKTPAAFLPQYGGFCTNGIVYGIPWGGDADSWKIVDGKLYIFGGSGSKRAFELDVPGNIKLAEKYWAEEVNGSNAFFQRTKRLVMKVPHYKSGAELAAAVEGKK